MILAKIMDTKRRDIVLALRKECIGHTVEEAIDAVGFLYAELIIKAAPDDIKAQERIVDEVPRVLRANMLGNRKEVGEA